MKERFEQIYATREWGQGSGGGSLPLHNRGYVAFIERYLATHGIRSVIDVGCGDWQFSRFISWGASRYEGYDLVRSVIEGNQRDHSAPGVSFHLYSGDPAELPPADLLIAKDVLQHWSNAAIQRFLPILSRYPHALITNCANPRGATVNTDIMDGDFRYLDLRSPPFSVAATEVYTFANHRHPLAALFRRRKWLKRVLAVRH